MFHEQHEKVLPTLNVPQPASNMLALLRTVTPSVNVAFDG
jgi:hypothetical protein